ncbi:MAG: MFS transporter, partial [SAR324 cluster bacterium]|nr:MFS transporter [SAR324 cluster bacterium]
MFATFAGAFLDLVLKTGILFLPAAFSGVPIGQVSLFVLLALFPSVPAPFVAAWAGLACDRFGKSKIIILVKFLEVLLAIGAALSLLSDNFLAAYIMLFLFGSTDAAFTTAKFAILPAMIPQPILSWGNGLIMLAKYSAFVLGIVVTGALIFLKVDLMVYLSGIYVAVACTGLLVSLLIHEDPALSAKRRESDISFDRLYEYFQEIRTSKHLFLSMLSFAYFLIVGAVFQFNTSIFLAQGTGFTENRMSLLFAILALGIGLGGLGAGIVSRSKVEIGLVPIGAFGVGLSLCLSALLIDHFYLLAVVYLIAGMCGGFCVVPLYSLFQQNTPAEKRGIYMGISQAVSNSGLFIVLLIVLVLQVFAASYPAIIFMVMGIITIGISAFALSHTPIALIRCLNWIFTNFVYRIRAFGIENVPENGGALLVCNHISYFDPLLVSASVQRTVRFLILRSLFHHKLLGPILRTMKAIPISSKDAPKMMLASLHDAREAIKRGELVCVFAEGEPARVGHMIRFSRGLEIIMKGLDAPIIPAYLDQTWGSLFDYVDGKYKLRVPQEIPYPATLTYGKALKPDANTFEIRQTISELGSEAFKNRRKEQQFLHLGFMKEAKRKPFRTCMVESTGKRLTNFRALVGAVVLSRELKKRLLPDNKNVGIFLPPSIGSALSNIALLLCNLVPVNLNYTASKEASRSSIEQAEIKQVLTSRLFLSKIEGPEGVEFIYLDELINQIKKKDKLLSLVFIILTPFFLLKILYKTGTSSYDSLATIIFSSGSTGIPKGVMLSHANISSNVESMFNAVHMKRSDVLVSVLPFFHAFGYTTGLWLP